MSLVIFQGLQQVVCLAPLALGVWLSFFLLRFPDFTFQGSFVLGGAVFAAVLHARSGSFAWALLALICAGVAGGAAGLLTSAFNSRLRVPTLLSGIGVSFVCYSAALLVMSGAMLEIDSSRSLIGPFLLDEGKVGQSREALLAYLRENALRELAVVTVVSAALFGVFRVFLTSRAGLLLRASGLNPAACRTYGFSPEPWQLMGLGWSNFCCGLSGALFAENLRFADVGFGSGVVALCLGVVILAEGLGRQSGWSGRLVLLVGALAAFQAIRMSVLRLPLGSDYLRLAEGAMLVLAVALTARVRGRHPVWDLRL